MKRLLLFLFGLFALYTTTVATTDKNREVLIRELSTATDTTRLNILFQLIKVTYQDPNEQVIYIDQLLDEANKQNNNFYKCQAYLQHMIQAYNTYDSEGVNKWMVYLEPLARKEKLYDMLFRGKQCVVDMLLMQEQYELEEKEAKLMLKEAKSLDNIIGQILAYHSLSHVYMMTDRYDEAFCVLEKAIALRDQCSNKFLYVEVLRTMILVCEYTKKHNQWLTYLNLQDEAISGLEKLFPNESFQGDRMLSHLSYIRYYIEQKDIERASHHFTLSKQAFSDQFSMIYQYKYHEICCHYFMAIEQWEEALQSINNVLRLIESATEVEYTNNLALKARILNKIGQEKTALQLHKQVKQLKDSLRVSTINKQTRELEKSYEHDLLILNRATHQQYIRLTFLILSICIILILAIYAIHTFLVKQKLMRAEQEMRIMMDETEQANLIKERLLSNINMTIRPPLDIIIQNSSRLSSDEAIDDAQKEELSTLINQTSAQLMNLINDILLLSKLEAKMMKFTLSEVDLVGLLRNVSETVNSRTTDRVLIDMTTEYKSSINGSETYLIQVFNKIFTTTLETNKPISVQFATQLPHTLQIQFSNTGLATDKTSQELVISNEINRMIIEAFGGEYHIYTTPPHPHITIIFATTPS